MIRYQLNQILIFIDILVLHYQLSTYYVFVSD